VIKKLAIKKIQLLLNKKLDLEQYHLSQAMIIPFYDKTLESKQIRFNTATIDLKIEFYKAFFFINKDDLKD